MTLPALALERWRRQYGARSYRPLFAADAAVAAVDRWD